MVQEVQYKSYYEIENEKPHIELGFKFKDYFETNKYYLVSESKKYQSLDNLTFDIIKENKEIGKIKLKNLDFDSFLEEFSNMTNDYDFKKIVISEHKEKIKKDLNVFFETFKKNILENKVTLEGEIKRMRSIAGII